MAETKDKNLWVDQLDNPHEQWKEIEEFPGYSVSDYGRVRNDSSGRMLAITENQFGLAKVAMSKDGKQLTRGLSFLVASYFLEKPPLTTFSTTINLDGDRFNNRLENLMWRPEWFAVKYHKQFKPGARKGFKVPIQVLSTGDIFPNSMAASMQYGILAEDTVMSVLNLKAVFPTYQRFKLLEEIK